MVLPADEMGEKFGAKFGLELATTNLGSMLALLGIATASRTSQAISSLFTGSTPKAAPTTATAPSSAYIAEPRLDEPIDAADKS